MKILLLAVGITHVTAFGVTKSLVTLGAAYRWSGQYPAHFVVRKIMYMHVHVYYKGKRKVCYIYFFKKSETCVACTIIIIINVYTLI